MSPPEGGRRDGQRGRPFAKRSLGQNFLVDPNIAAKIVAAAHIAPEDTVLEIGPGRGALTRFIAEARPGRFFALEKDRGLARALSVGPGGPAVVVADAMDFAFERLAVFSPVKVVGNLPYNIASPLLWRLCSEGRGIERVVCMVQLEVARRIAAAPGGREYGALSVWLQSFARPTLLFKVGPDVFRPRPKVDSAVLLLRPLPEAARPVDPAALSGCVKRLFSGRRKQLRTLLRHDWSEELEKILFNEGLRPTSRPEELSPAGFANIAENLKNRFPS